MTRDGRLGRPPRVLIVTHYWAPHVGGIERVAGEHAERLARRGWQVRVATSRLRGDLAIEGVGSVVVSRYRCTNFLERWLHVPVPLVAPSMLRDLRRLTEWADVVIAHGHVYVGSAYAALAARRSATPLVLVQHSPFVGYGKVLDWLERFVDHTLGARVIRSAAAVITVSRHTQEFVRSLAPDIEPLVIHSAVDGERFAPPPDRPDHGCLTFLTVRRLVPRNGVDVLVKSWRRAALGDRAGLVIAGTGPEEHRLRALAADDDSIDFLGFVAEDRLPDLYRDADVFVLPSRSGEGFGLAAAEALASGVPVIATASGGVADLVRHGVNGILVPPADVDALAVALRALVGDAPLRARLRGGARDSIEHVSWDRSIDQLEAVLMSRLDR